MASVEMQGFDELEKFLGKLAEPTGMAIEAVNAAAPILEEGLKSEISSAANKGYATGELVNHIRKTKAKKNQYGVFSVVGPVGERTRKNKTNNGAHTVRFAEELAYLEYGTSNGQGSHPVRQKAINRTEAKCEAIIEKKISDAIDKLW